MYFRVTKAKPDYCVAEVPSRPWVRGISQCTKKRRADTRDGEWCGFQCPDRCKAKADKEKTLRHAEYEHQHVAKIDGVLIPFKTLAIEFEKWMQGSAGAADFLERIDRIAAEEVRRRVGNPWWRE